MMKPRMAAVLALSIFSLVPQGMAGEPIFESMIELGANEQVLTGVPNGIQGSVGILYIPSGQFVTARDSFRYGKLWTRTLIEDWVHAAIATGTPILDALADAGIHGIFFQLGSEIERDEVHEIASLESVTAGGGIEIDGRFRMDLEGNVGQSHVIIFPKAWMNYFKVNPTALASGGLATVAGRADFGPEGGYVHDGADGGNPVAGLRLQVRGLMQFVIAPPGHGIEIEASGYGAVNFYEFNELPFLYGGEVALRYTNTDEEGDRWYIGLEFEVDSRDIQGGNNESNGLTFAGMLVGGKRF